MTFTQKDDSHFALIVAFDHLAVRGRFIVIDGEYLALEAHIASRVDV